MYFIRNIVFEIFTLIQWFLNDFENLGNPSKSQKKLFGNPEISVILGKILEIPEISYALGSAVTIKAEPAYVSEKSNVVRQ